MNCLLWNPQSLQNKVLDFIQLLEDNNIDIAFITESWMTCQNNHTSALLRESGYTMYHNFRQDKVGGGVAIVAQTSLIPKNGKTMVYNTFEVFIQSLKVFKNSQPIALVTLYRLGRESKSDFLDEFYTFTEFLRTNFSNFIMCGDYNIHVNKPNDNFVSDFHDILNTFGLQQSINEPTHVCGNTLDLIIHDPSTLEVRDICVEQPEKSDHSLIFFKMRSNLESCENREISFRNFNTVDSNAFSTDIQTGVDTFLTGCNSDSFEESFLLFDNIFGEIVNSHAPLVTKSVSINPKPGWMDEEFKSARRERRKLYKIWKRKQTDSNRDNFLQKRREVNDLSFSKRKDYLAKCIADSSNPQRDLHKICDSLLDVRISSSLPDCVDSSQLANTFNQYFVHKIVKIREEMSCINITNVHVNKLNYGIGGENCARGTLSSFTPVSADELKKIILSRKIKTSIKDTIPANLLRNCLDHLLPVLVKLVNISLATGSIQGLENSVITPLLKKTGLDTEILSNYRPVANILYISKLTETAVSSQLQSHMSINDLHVPNQSGYKTGHSCETLLLKIVDDILKTLDSGRCIIYLLMDLSSAFDTVEHDRVLSQLDQEIGVRGVALTWFESYLKHRRQAVNIKGHISDFVDTSYGVPQGSVLGPILFNIYVRNFIRVLQEAGFNAHGYADDHQASKIFGIEFQYEAIRYSIPRCLDIVAHWMKASFLKLNASKSQVIIFAPKNLADQIVIDQIKLSDGSIIPVSTMVNNLGVKLDSMLTFTPQINSICSSSYRLLRNLASVRKFLCVKDLRLLVQSIIISRIDNCNSLLYGVLVLSLKKLQKVQNACARLIYGIRKRDHVSPILRELHWLPVKQRIIFKILLFVFKYYHSTAPVYIAQCLYKSDRGDYTLKVPRTSTRYGDRAFSNCAPRLWNALPLDIRSSNSISYFRSHLKHVLFSNFDTFISQANIYID